VLRHPAFPTFFFSQIVNILFTPLFYLQLFV
jgi:hypothetical protein